MSYLKEKCGICAIWGHNNNVSTMLYILLLNLQHRGQDSAGIVCFNQNDISIRKNFGLVAEVFTPEFGSDLSGNIAIGHVRYSTSGGNLDKDLIQPLVIDTRIGKVTLAHNGNLSNLSPLINFLNENNIDVDNSNDSWYILKGIAYFINKGSDITEAIEEIFDYIVGAFSIVISTKDNVIAIRDRCGIRPLSFGRLENGDYIIASETCALDSVNCSDIQDVLPGEMIMIKNGELTRKIIRQTNQKLDIFEFIYFSRPDSVLLGRTLQDVRKRFGSNLFKEKRIEADMIVPIPESGIPAAIGYSLASNIPFEMALIKNRYVHRTFISSNNQDRKSLVKQKLNIVKSLIKDKIIILIDDSLVRGNTSKTIIKMLRDNGAKEIHFLSSCPPIKYPDFYGIDIPDQSKLLSAIMTEDDIRKELGADSLQFLSFEGMVDAIGVDKDLLCTSCLDGNYPIDIGDNMKNIKKF